MHYLIALMLAFLSLLAVSYPLLKTRERGGQSPALSNAKERLGRKVEDAFDDIDRLQMEFELGVIERQEYQQQMDDLRRVAAVSLHAYEEEAQEESTERPLSKTGMTCWKSASGFAASPNVAKTASLREQAAPHPSLPAGSDGGRNPVFALRRRSEPHRIHRPRH